MHPRDGRIAIFRRIAAFRVCALLLLSRPIAVLHSQPDEALAVLYPLATSGSLEERVTGPGRGGRAPGGRRRERDRLSGRAWSRR
jgi:hypothetical protein